MGYKDEQQKVGDRIKSPESYQKKNNSIKAIRQV